MTNTRLTVLAQWGALIRATMRAQEISIKKFCSENNINRTTLYRIFQGKATNLNEYRNISQIIGLPLDVALINKDSQKIIH